MRRRDTPVSVGDRQEKKERKKEGKKKREKKGKIDSEN